jgi:hypothetical protein
LFFGREQMQRSDVTEVLCGYLGLGAHTPLA